MNLSIQGLIEGLRRISRLRFHIPWLKISVSRGYNGESCQIKEHIFLRSAVLIGNKRDCDVVLGDLSEGFEIERRGTRYFLNKNNKINEVRALSQDLLELYDGDRIDLGSVQLKIGHGNFSIAFFPAVIVILSVLICALFVSSAFNIKMPQECFETQDLKNFTASEHVPIEKQIASPKDARFSSATNEIAKPSGKTDKKNKPVSRIPESKNALSQETPRIVPAKVKSMEKEGLSIDSLLEAHCKDDPLLPFNEDDCSMATKIREFVKNGKSDLVSGSLDGAKNNFIRALEAGRKLKHHDADLSNSISELLAQVVVFIAEVEYEKKDYDKALVLLHEALSHSPNEEKKGQLTTRFKTLLKNTYLEAYMLESSEPERALELYKKITKISDKNSEIYIKSQEKLKNLEISSD